MYCLPTLVLVVVLLHQYAMVPPHGTIVNKKVDNSLLLKIIPCSLFSTSSLCALLHY